jgi:hypothetical protein
MARKILFPHPPERENYIQKIVRFIKEYFEVIQRVLSRFSPEMSQRVIAQMERDFVEIRKQAKQPTRPICVYLVAPYDKTGAILGEHAYFYDRYKIERLEKEGYSVVPYLANSMQEVFNNLLPSIQANYPARSIDLLNFSSHGTRSSLYVAAAPFAAGSQEADVFTCSHVQPEQFGALSPNASIILDACSTGKGENSIAEAMAKNNPGKTVFAAERSFFFSKPVFSRSGQKRSLTHLLYGPAFFSAYQAKKFYFPNSL